MKKAATLFAIALLGTAGSAQAGHISYSAAIASALTNWNNVLTLQQFDSSLGVLDAMVFTYNTSVATTFQAENHSNRAATLTATSTTTVSFAAPVSQSLVATNSVSQAVSAYDRVADFGGASSLNPNPLTLVADASSSATLTSDLAAFIGSGTYAIAVTANGVSSVTGSSNVAYGISTRAGAGITVDYSYHQLASSIQQVPEPGSLALVGSALCGVALLKRRRPQA